MEKEAPMPFVELMLVEELRNEEGEEEQKNVSVGERRFMSLNPSYEPGGGSAYGGHVFAQAVWAAAGTVDEGLVAHNVHGFFTLPGLPDRPYIYNVLTLSSGRSYATRYVTAKQPLTPSLNRPFRAEDSKGELSNVCFACLVSFKRDERVSDEESGTGHQMKESVKGRFKHIFDGLKPESLEINPDVDAPWFYRHVSKNLQPATFPGLEMRKLTVPSPDPSTWTNLTFYRPVGPIPPSAYNLHACAHMYASDRNSIEIVGNALGWGDEVGSIGSLSHSVVFHVEKAELVMREAQWWVQEAKTMRSGQGRGLHESWIWKLGDGGGGGETWKGKGHGKAVHIASQWQEGMIRRVQQKEGQRQRLLWEEGMRKKELQMGWEKDCGSGKGKSKL